MAGLAWNYIEPIPMSSSDLIASNIQASKQGLVNGMVGLQSASDYAQAMEANRFNLSMQGLTKDSNQTPRNALQPNLDSRVPNAPIIQNNPSKAAYTVGGLAKAQTDLAKPYMGAIQNASETYNVPQDILLAVAQTESGFKPDAISPTGVKGIMQVTQNTYEGLGFKGDRADPTNSINAGAKLLGQLYQQYGNWDDALAHYNGGADAVRGLHTGNWGVWSDNLNKQKEISNYAPKVNNYRTAWNS